MAAARDTVSACQGQGESDRWHHGHLCAGRQAADRCLHMHLCLRSSWSFSAIPCMLGRVPHTRGPHAIDQRASPAPKERSGMVCHPAGGGPQPSPSWRTQPQCSVSPARFPSGCRSPAASAACMPMTMIALRHPGEAPEALRLGPGCSHMRHCCYGAEQCNLQKQQQELAKAYRSSPLVYVQSRKHEIAFMMLSISPLHTSGP